MPDNPWRTDIDQAPTNGTEFEYISRGRVRIGSLGHDLGGSIKRDPDMTHWRPIIREDDPDA